MFAYLFMWWHEVRRGKNKIFFFFFLIIYQNKWQSFFSFFFSFPFLRTTIKWLNKCFATVFDDVFNTTLDRVIYAHCCAIHEIHICFYSQLNQTKNWNTIGITVTFEKNWRKLKLNEQRPVTFENGEEKRKNCVEMKVRLHQNQNMNKLFSFYFYFLTSLPYGVVLATLFFLLYFKTNFEQCERIKIHIYICII